MDKVLITGASGLIGTRLTELLLQQRREVAHLGRTKRAGSVPSFLWDVHQQQIEPSAFENTNAIIHLAGAGVADKRWNASRKKEILESRIQSTQLLYNALKNNPNQVKVLVSASAIGYYGFGMEDRELDEDYPPGSDFLADVTKQWEEAVDKISSLGVRVVKIRIGIVLSKKAGALVEIARPIKWWVGAPLGTGKQMVSWIHIDDLCEIFTKALNDVNMVGAFNAVAPHPVTNKEMTKAIAHTLRKPLWLPPVPTFVLRLLIGEMADMILNGSNVSAKKISNAGYKFKFPTLESALKDLLHP